MSMHGTSPPPSVPIGLALPLSACFVDGAPFDPELCPQAIVVELDHGESTIVLEMDVADFVHSAPEFGLTTQPMAKAPAAGARISQ